MATTKIKFSHSSLSFLTLIDKQIQYLQDGGRLGTAKNYLCARKSFTVFLQGEDFSLADMDSKLILRYELWLKKRNVSRNTISFYMRILRSVYNKAVDNRLVMRHDLFDNVYTGVDCTRKRAVDEEIIVRLNKLNLSSSFAMEYARDLFVFSFYVRGMAFVDMAYLRKSDVKDNVLQYVRHKTGQRMSIRLEPCMLKIINHYAVKTVDSPYIFPIIKSLDKERAYNQYRNVLCYYNKQLKKISVILGLSNPLTSYVSRHTWATTARNKNIPISIISAGMGHRSETTTRIYLASLDSSVIDDANKLIISDLMI